MQSTQLRMRQHAGFRARPAVRAVCSQGRRALRVAAFKDGYKVLVVGGGSGGITTAAHYARKMPGQVAVIEPSKYHYYQPLWTLVGGGFKEAHDSRRPTADVMPKGADWLPTHVTEFRPEESLVITSEGQIVKYDYLVVATGMQPKWDRVKGLSAALGDGRVVSNMSYATAPLTYAAASSLERGHALFTMPKGVVKCPGAGHKVCYISEDNFRRRGLREGPEPSVRVTLAMAGDKIFGIPRYAATIQGLVDERNIGVKLGTNLVEVRGGTQEAVFERLGPNGQVLGEEVMHYDMLHVTPPQGPLDVVAKSALATPDGWVDTNSETLQHMRYPNVFGIGDCANVPTSKTAAAAAAQFLVLRDNLDALMAGQAADEVKYDGYTSCPLITKKNACMMMEFGYGGKILETFTPLGLVDQSKEDYLMWLVKKDVLPWAYWNVMTKGFVPWCEFKNMLKRLPASAPAPEQPALQPAPQSPTPEPGFRASR
ncbi:MAG: hypothetical protein J3K34DRAFT_421158 [Monoraphidium minutum]|nr:MAG: hypothetical protein J3K34DRAFT_421158 [Monoraphidium minutum]